MEPEDLLSRSTNKEPEVRIQQYEQGTGGSHSAVRKRNRRFSFRSMDRSEPAVLTFRILERSEPEVLIFPSIIRPEPEVPRIPKSGKTGTGGSQKGVKFRNRRFSDSPAFFPVFFPPLFPPSVARAIASKTDDVAKEEDDLQQIHTIQRLRHCSED
ncbi:unnamed protein product [Sphagnum jensenii]|uniref:Uncharacterized protein n=1 Tax=Sphagnum jensenii TaxID=128206 RepID=A0ABP1BDU1_9BRYO